MKFYICLFISKDSPEIELLVQMVHFKIFQACFPFNYVLFSFVLHLEM